MKYKNEMNEKINELDAMVKQHELEHTRVEKLEEELTQLKETYGFEKASWDDQKLELKERLNEVIVEKTNLNKQLTKGLKEWEKKHGEYEATIGGLFQQQNSIQVEKEKGDDDVKKLEARLQSVEKMRTEEKNCTLKKQMI